MALQTTRAECRESALSTILISATTYVFFRNSFDLCQFDRSASSFFSSQIQKKAIPIQLTRVLVIPLKKLLLL